MLVDGGTGEEVRSTELAGSVVPGRLLFDAEGDTLVVGSQSGRLYFLDAATLRRTHPDRVVTAGYVFDAQLSPDGSVLAVMGSDGDVTLFDTATWKPYGKPVVDKLGWGFMAFEEDRLRIYGGSARTTRSTRTPPPGSPPPAGSPTPPSPRRSQPSSFPADRFAPPAVRHRDQAATATRPALANLGAPGRSPPPT